MNEQKAPRLGKLPPQYIFILNPYTDARFSRCPKCEQKMHQRKVPLFIHVDPFNPVVLGYTCRYCPDCDLLIAHQDRIEALLTNLFAEHAPEIVGNDYLVLGTVERTAWREGMKQPKGIDDMLAHLHDFKEVRTVEYRPAGWFPADDPDDRIPLEEPTVQPKLAGQSTSGGKPRKQGRRKVRKGR